MSGIYLIPRITVLDLVGADALAILNNLTTNDVSSLEVGCGCETFLTDVRGKTLAHVYAYRTPEGYRLLGAAGQSEAIASHADRYTIREDAVPVDHSDDFSAIVLSPSAPASVRDETDWGECGAHGFGVDWLGVDTVLLLAQEVEPVLQRFSALDLAVGDEDGFHAERTSAGFPWFGVDLSEKNLPQEASRIEQSISFVKGCYLGQETVARLDALGQVQKQLVRWETNGKIPRAGSEVKSDDKVVGRLTSVVATGDETAVAIGMARRSHFDQGSQAEGDGFAAVVLG